MAHESRITVVLRTVSLSIGMVAASWTSPRAEDVPALTPEVVAAYQRKLSRARDDKTTLDGRLVCLRQYDGTLVTRRDQDQSRLGDLRKQEHELDVSYAGLKFTHKSTLDSLNRYQGDYTNGVERLKAINAEISSKRASLDTCRTVGMFLWFVLAGCEIADVIDELSGKAAALRTANIEANRQVQQAQKAAQDTAASLQKTEIELSALRTRQSSVSDGLKTLEVDITNVDHLLSDVRSQSQGNAILADNLQTILGGAAAIDTADGRARTARAAFEIARSIDAAVANSEALIVSTAQLLPAGMTSNCSAP